MEAELSKRGTFSFVTFRTLSDLPSSCGSTGSAHLATRGLLSLPAEERSASKLTLHRAAPSRRSHLHGCTMATFVCRVQFLDDTDPFNSTNFPEPTRPPVYTFREDIPLINQIAGVHRLLKAPHKVGPLVNCKCKTIRNSTCYWYFPDCFCCCPNIQTDIFSTFKPAEINTTYPPFTGYFEQAWKQRQHTSDWLSRPRTDRRLQMFASEATATLNMDLFLLALS